MCREHAAKETQRHFEKVVKSLEAKINSIAEQVNNNGVQLYEIQGALHEHGQRLFDIEGSVALQEKKATQK